MLHKTMILSFARRRPHGRTPVGLPIASIKVPLAFSFLAFETEEAVYCLLGGLGLHSFIIA